MGAVVLFILVYKIYITWDFGYRDADIKKTHSVVKYYGHKEAWAG